MAKIGKIILIVLLVISVALAVVFATLYFTKKVSNKDANETSKTVLETVVKDIDAFLNSVSTESAESETSTLSPYEETDWKTGIGILKVKYSQGEIDGIIKENFASLRDMLSEYLAEIKNTKESDLEGMKVTTTIGQEIEHVGVVFGNSNAIKLNYAYAGPNNGKTFGRIEIGLTKNLNDWTFFRIYLGKTYSKTHDFDDQPSFVEVRKENGAIAGYTQIDGNKNTETGKYEIDLLYDALIGDGLYFDLSKSNETKKITASEDVYGNYELLNEKIEYSAILGDIIRRGWED